MLQNFTGHEKLAFYPYEISRVIVRIMALVKSVRGISFAKLFSKTDGLTLIIGQPRFKN